MVALSKFIESCQLGLVVAKTRVATVAGFFFALNDIKRGINFTPLCVCAYLGLQHEGIFRVSGSQVEVNDIKNAFERGKTVIQQETIFNHFFQILYFLFYSPLLITVILSFKRRGPTGRGPE